MALKDLLTDLSNFKYTDYDNAGTNNSQIEGRHGSTVHPDDHSIKDDKVGFGVYPNDTPQSFDVRGYTITGDKILFTGDGNNSDVLSFNAKSQFVSNDDYLMKTDMLDTKKFPARDNNVIGFDQPFILKDIGDRWGPGGLGAIDAGIVRGGLVTSIARTAADVIRLGKFAITPRGIMFGLKQAGLQLLNPRGDTRIWNPLSLGSIAPMVHVDRHLGGKTYETSPFGPAGFTILGAYAGAIETGKGWTLIQKGMRTTIAHQLGMVPTAGGKPGSFPAEPEIKFDDDDGTIESLSKNILSTTVGKFPHSGTNHYELNGEYAISHGTPIIPQTVPEAGSWIIKDKIDASKEMGESISKTLTDAVIEKDVFTGNAYSYNKDNRYGKFAKDNKDDESRKFVQLTPNYGLTRKIFSNEHDNFGYGKNLKDYILIPRSDQIKDAPLPFANPVRKAGVFDGDEYNKDNRYADGYSPTSSDTKPIKLGHLGSIIAKQKIVFINTKHTDNITFSGNLGDIGEIKTKLDPSRPDNKFLSKIFGTEKHNMTRISTTNFHFGGNIYSVEEGKGYLEGIIAGSTTKNKGELAHSYSVNTEAPFGEWPLGLASVGKGTVFQGNIFEKKDKEGSSTIVFATDLYSDSVTYGSLYKKYEAVAETEPHQFQHTRLILDSKGEPQLTYSLAHLTSNLAAVDSKALQLTAGTTVPIKDNVVTLDQYKDFPWSTLFLVGRSPENFQGNLYGPDGRKRYGFMTYSENVSLPQMRAGESPISYKRRLTPVQQKLWRRQKIDDMKRRIRDEKDKLGVQGGSLSITTVKKVENGEETSKFEVITVEGADGKDVVIPTVVKAKVSRNDLAPQVVEPDPDATFQDDTGQQAPAVISVPEQSVNVLDKPDILTEAGAETPPVPTDTQQNQESIVPTQTTPTGNQTALKKYKTLAYGDLGNDETKYGKQWASAGETVETGFQGKMTPADAQQVLDDRKGGSGKVWNMGNPGTPGVTQVYDPELGAAVKLKGAEIGSGYNTDLVDKVNMHPYGKEDLPDGVDDFIKFKFKDIVNNKFIIFRAALSGISEALSPEWSSERYIGRPDSVHVYQGVERSMSFEFMVVPHTRQELPILWEKMNYLVGLTYPTWKSIGPYNRMEAPFINLTIGDMYNSVPGYLSSLSITVEDQATWEIEDGFQLPKALNVSCEFTHIGRHPLASQGKHYGLSWLQKYDNSKKWTDGDSHLGARGIVVKEGDNAPNVGALTGLFGE